MKETRDELTCFALITIVPLRRIADEPLSLFLPSSPSLYSPCPFVSQTERGEKGCDAMKKDASEVFMRR